MLRPLVAAVLIATLCACSGTGSGQDAGIPDAGPLPLQPPPELFDCTAAAPPERSSTTPVECLLDPACRTRLVAGHRGAGGQLGVIAPEDTLAGYRAAIAVGADFAETDPRPTADGFLVNVHDTSVDRTTDGTGDVAALTLAQVQALHVDADRFPGDFSCERVPTLEEILATCRGKIVVLVDANKTDRVDLLVKAIQTTDTFDWALFDTSSVAKIDQAIALEPRLRTMIRVSSVADADAQLDHFAAHPPVIVEIDRGADVALVAERVHARGQRAFTDVFFEDFTVSVDGNLRAYDKSWALGIDIAQTDRPGELLRYLKRR
ncbi:MAG: glycerophosphodiester phosphodiesterase family protein [Myxococcaceae bacterium]